MFQEWINKNYHYFIIIPLVLVVTLIFFWRYYLIFKIRLKIKPPIQKPEFRENYFLTRDQYKLPANYFYKKQNKIIIINVHDLASSYHQFDLINNYFKTNNFNYFGFNLRLNYKNKDNENIGTIIQDLIDNINILQEIYPSHKFYLFGQGLGANIILMATKKLKNISGLLLFNCISKKKLFKLNFISTFLMIFGFWFNVKIKLPLTLNYPLLSNNVNVQNQIKNNLQDEPLKLWQLVQITKVSKKSLKKLKNINIPTLIVQSNNDIFANIKNINRNINKNKFINLNIVTDYHDLLQSNFINEYFELIKIWIK